MAERCTDVAGAEDVCMQLGRLQQAAHYCAVATNSAEARQVADHIAAARTRLYNLFPADADANRAAPPPPPPRPAAGPAGPRPEVAALRERWAPHRPGCDHFMQGADPAAWKDVMAILAAADRDYRATGDAAALALLNEISAKAFDDDGYGQLGLRKSALPRVPPRSIIARCTSVEYRAAVARCQEQTVQVVVAEGRAGMQQRQWEWDTYVLSQLDAKEEYPDLNPLQRSEKRYEAKRRAAAAKKRAAAATAEARGEGEGTQREVEDLVAAASDTICKELFAEAATEGAAAVADSHDSDAGAGECPLAPEGPAAGPEAGWPAELAEILTASGGAGDGGDEGCAEASVGVVAMRPTDEAEIEESAQPAALVMTGPQRAPLLSNDDEAPTAQDVDESQELIMSKVTAVVLMSCSLHAATAVTKDAAAPMPVSATTRPSAAPGPKTEAQAGAGGGDGDRAPRAGARVRIPKKSLNKTPQVTVRAAGTRTAPAGDDKSSAKILALDGPKRDAVTSLVPLSFYSCPFDFQGAASNGYITNVAQTAASDMIQARHLDVISGPITPAPATRGVKTAPKASPLGLTPRPVPLVPSTTSSKTHGADATATALLLKTICSPRMQLQTTTSGGVARVAGQPVKSGSLTKTSNKMAVLKAAPLTAGETLKVQLLLAATTTATNRCTSEAEGAAPATSAAPAALEVAPLPSSRSKTPVAHARPARSTRPCQHPAWGCMAGALLLAACGLATAAVALLH